MHDLKTFCLLTGHDLDNNFDQGTLLRLTCCAA